MNKGTKSTIEICEFFLEYYDSITKKTEHFKCENPAQKNHLCEFHDETYLTETTKQTVINLFQTRLQNFNTPGNILKCVGYHLSEVAISGEIKVSVDFTQAHFHDNVTIENVKFNENVQFSETEFDENHRVSFIGSEFSKKAHFLYSTILGNEVQFNSAIFQSEANFTRTTIRNAFFNICNFDEVNFTNAIFRGPSNFWNADFNGTAKFTGTTFMDIAKFSNSTFKSHGDFQKAAFLNPTYFRQVRFEGESKIIFNSNLHFVSFLDSDLKKVKFGNDVEWKRKILAQGFWQKINEQLRKIYSKNNEFKIHDERVLENQSEQELNLESVMDTYRNLRDNYDFELRYEMAGEFFVREMELKRKYKNNKNGFPKTKKQNLLRRRIFSIHSYYHILAQYGQSYYRPIWIASPILIISFLCFWTEQFSNLTVVNLENFFSEKFNSAMIRTISAFIPFFAFHENVNLYDLFLRIFLIPVSGTFFIALKRKLERKFRH